MAFDVGVYLTVVGAAMLALANLGRIEAGTHKRVETRSIAWQPDEPGPRAGALAAKADAVPARAKEP
jgi:hypothetical protein